MEAKKVMDIVGEADCHSEVCFTNSKGVYEPLGWARNLIEISFKAGEEKEKQERKIVTDEQIEADEDVANLNYLNGRKEVMDWLKEYAVHGGNISLRNVLLDMEVHSPFMNKPSSKRG